ncbi:MULTISPECIES: hypothetical protein [unclassified Mesorhizobium]|nr:hypothetical protein [Mesorhizobium sp.]RWQ69478.1 MAG: hypothetical protein EOS85_28725 [Mesorhizobium sp.]TIL47110.1 MAG: hypothetical protein E5Y83_34485 [Mesorhizobium sp.]TIL83920.1 MAG: hypothetical protein E5Y73_35530 [Mesorhizobium sp.]
MGLTPRQAVGRDGCHRPYLWTGDPLLRTYLFEAASGCYIERGAGVR